MVVSKSVNEFILLTNAAQQSNDSDVQILDVWVRNVIIKHVELLVHVDNGHSLAAVSQTQCQVIKNWLCSYPHMYNRLCQLNASSKVVNIWDFCCRLLLCNFIMQQKSCLATMPNVAANKLWGKSSDQSAFRLSLLQDVQQKYQYESCVTNFCNKCFVWQPKTQKLNLPYPAIITHKQ